MTTRPAIPATSWPPTSWSAIAALAALLAFGACGTAGDENASGRHRGKVPNGESRGNEAAKGATDGNTPLPVPFDADGGTDGTCTLCGGACLTEEFPVLTASHTLDPVDYPNPPPVGGDHNPCWASWGVHDTAVADDNWVHNLEHGGVVILHNCTEHPCPDELATLAAYAKSLGSRALMTPYPAMDVRFAAVTWGFRLRMNCLDMKAFQEFVTEHLDKAPESSTAAPPEGCPK